MWTTIGAIVCTFAAIRDGINENMFWCILYAVFAVYWDVKLFNNIKKTRLNRKIKH